MACTSVRLIGAGSTTLVIEENSGPNSAAATQPQSVVLRLNRRKKKVTWKEGTVDNEFLQRKSSKSCCIFHKQKSFDEDASDDEKECPGSDNPKENHDDGCGSSSH